MVIPSSSNSGMRARTAASVVGRGCPIAIALPVRLAICRRSTQAVFGIGHIFLIIEKDVARCGRHAGLACGLLAHGGRVRSRVDEEEVAAFGDHVETSCITRASALALLPS